MNGTLVFPGRDANGCEPWRSDGLRADLLMDINPGPANSLWPGFTTPLVDVSGLVVFGADDGVHGHELWATDGTSTTRLVQDISEGAGWSSPRSFTSAGPLVFFTADNHVSGVELWAISKSALHQTMNLPETIADVDDATRRQRAPDEFRAFLPFAENDPNELVASEEETP